MQVLRADGAHIEIYDVVSSARLGKDTHKGTAYLVYIRTYVACTYVFVCFVDFWVLEK